MPKVYAEDILLEKTPSYLTVPWVAERLFHFNASLRLVLILLDPTQRLVSEYAHHIRINRYLEHFCTAVWLIQLVDAPHPQQQVP